MYLLLIFSFLAGIVTVLSPCILPVLPILLSSGTAQGKSRPLGIVIGVIISFTFFTLMLKSLVEATDLNASILRSIAIFIIAFFGLVMIFPKLSGLFSRATRGIQNLGERFQSNASSGFWSSLTLGLALGLVWTPCAGPILASIITLVAFNQLTFTAFLMTFFYSLGAAVPMFLIAYGGQRVLNTSKSLSHHVEGIRKGFGVLMLFTALAIGMNWDQFFTQKALVYIPNVDIENNPAVIEQLSKITGNESPYAKSAQQTSLSNSGKAPVLTGIVDWLNTPPLSLEQLHGKVVLIDFWTYSCINCVRTLPYLTRWYDTYKDNGFVIIGVHTPEFEFEKEKENVENAIRRFDIHYPVALDNNYGTWKAYSNAYWPAHYLIDQKGEIRQVHFGEGKYLETENAIRSLLNLPAIDKKLESSTSYRTTSEIYLGYARANNYADTISIINNQPAEYNFLPPLSEDHIGLRGLWQVEKENILSLDDSNHLELNFLAEKVFLVLGGASLKPITILLDDKPVIPEYFSKDFNAQGQLFVKEPRMYTILDLKGNYGRHKLSIIIPQGIKAYAFTFG